MTSPILRGRRIRTHVVARLTIFYSIIFSSWTTSLNLVELHLRRLEIAHMRVDGNVEPSKRESIFDAFRDDENARILLMTTGTGAHGYVNVI